MRTLIVITLAGTLLGATAGWLFATLTENAPGYRSTAAFMDGMYVLLHTAFGCAAGAISGMAVGVALALARKR